MSLEELSILADKVGARILMHYEPETRLWWGSVIGGRMNWSVINTGMYKYPDDLIIEIALILRKIR